MKDSILIPTDFTVASLNLLKHALKDHKDEKRNYVLVFECNLGDSITDLLFLSKSTLVSSYASETFNEGLDILKSRFSDGIDSIRIEPFYGFTKAAFRNFTDANHVEKAYLPSKEIVFGSHKEMKFIYTNILKLKMETIQVYWNEVEEEYSPNTILQLFNA